MGDAHIKNVEDLIYQYTGSTKKIVGTKVSRLTAPGENYLGVVLKVDATLKDEKTGKEEQLNSVAKCIIIEKGVYMNMISISLYKKEADFYLEIAPALQKFVKDEQFEEDFDLFPKSYAVRKNLSGKNEIDSDAVMLLENLQVQGYVNIDKCTGFDLDGAKTLLKDLALFHAVPLAYKLKNPDGFERLKKYLKPPNFTVEIKEESFWVQIMREHDETKPYVKELARIMAYGPELLVKASPVEPYATIAHNDVWTNNTMQVLKDGKTIKNKFVDFQMLFYGSPAIDVILFLWTSIELSILIEHFDSLLDFYYNQLIKYLKKFEIDTSAFTYSNFEQELQLTTPAMIDGILFRLPLIFTKKNEGAPEFEQSRYLKKESIAENVLQRAINLVSIFGKKGWLQL